MSTALDPRLEALLARADSLPSLPGVALEVLRLCRADETTLDDLARVLSSDPALAARLLGFANSSLYASGEEVRTLQRATLVLGMKSVQLMSLSFSLVHAVPRAGRAGGFDYANYWRRSLVRAVSARALAGRIGLPAQDEAFLAGLLAEIGQVVLARCLAEPYAEVLRQSEARGLGWPSAELERGLLGFDHGDVGGALLAAWQLPNVLLLAVRHAQDPARLPADAPPELTTLARVLALAGHATDVLTRRDGGGALERAQAQAASWFGLAPTEFGSLLLALEAPIRETAELLELESAPGRGVAGHAQILAEAREEFERRSLERARQEDPGVPRDVDGLTGLASAAALEQGLAAELDVRLGGNQARPLGLLLVEIDDFARLPDEATRAEVQRVLGACLARLTRKHDLCARVAPGRFALLSTEANPFGLRALAARVREEVARLALALPASEQSLSVSLGGACLGAVHSASDGLALREVAERLLARAQARGGDQLEVHPGLLQS